jgi:hypothetical protein
MSSLVAVSLLMPAGVVLELVLVLVAVDKSDGVVAVDESDGGGVGAWDVAERDSDLELGVLCSGTLLAQFLI